MGSITQIYSSTQGEHKNTNKTLAIEASPYITPIYQQTQQRNSDGSGLIQAMKIKQQQLKQFSSFHRK
jgi:hypothetical protein